MSSPGKVVALALLWSTWTSTVDEALILWFYLSRLDCGGSFQVQTKLVAIIVIAAFVAEPSWRLLGLGPLLDCGHRNAAMTLSSTVNARNKGVFMQRRRVVIVEYR
jgi:hypothetical protein